MKLKDPKDFRVSIGAWLDYYDTRDYGIQASSFSSAVSKAIKKFRKDVGPRWIADLDIRVVRLSS